MSQGRSTWSTSLFFFFFLLEGQIAGVILYFSECQQYHKKFKNNESIVQSFMTLCLCVWLSGTSPLIPTEDANLQVS